MALTADKVLAEAQAIQAVCYQVAGAFRAAQKILDHNSNQAIDWAAATKPAYINEDASGNLTGIGPNGPVLFSRQQVANAVGSLLQFKNLMTNAAASTGDHLGNLNQLADPK